MFVKVKKKAPLEYYKQLILDFQAARVELSPEQLKFVIDMKNKKDERSK